MSEGAEQGGGAAPPGNYGPLSGARQGKAMPAGAGDGPSAGER